MGAFCFGEDVKKTVLEYVFQSPTQEKIMRIKLGPADHHAAVCISRVRFLGVLMRERLRKEGIWEDLIQELYATAFEAWKSGMDDIETRRFAQRRIYAFLKSCGFRLSRHGYFQPEKCFAAVFRDDIFDKGLAPRDYPPMRFIRRKYDDDHLDEKLLALLVKYPEGLTRGKLSMRFQISVQEVARYLAPMIKLGKVVEIKRENTRGRPLSPLLVVVEPGQTLPEPKMAKTEQTEHIRRAYFTEGKSIKQIAREFHHDRRTVRRAIGRIHRSNHARLDARLVLEALPKRAVKLGLKKMEHNEPLSEVERRYLYNFRHCKRGLALRELSRSVLKALASK